MLRPTLHTSAKAQYVPAAKLRQSYVCVRDATEAEHAWTEVYQQEEALRRQELWLLCGAILPIWTPLVAALQRESRGRELAFSVKKCTVGEVPLIGVALTKENVVALREYLASQEGGRAEDIAQAAKSRAEERRRSNARPRAETRPRLDDPEAAAPEVEEESSEDEEEEETALTFGSAAPAEAGDGTAPEDLLSMLI